MRKIILALAAVATVSFALPASAKTVIIKHGHHDHGMHRGWDHHHGHKTVIIKRH